MPCVCVCDGVFPPTLRCGLLYHLFAGVALGLPGILVMSHGSSLGKHCRTQWTLVAFHSHGGLHGSFMDAPSFTCQLPCTCVVYNCVQVHGDCGILSIVSMEKMEVQGARRQCVCPCECVGVCVWAEPLGRVWVRVCIEPGIGAKPCAVFTRVCLACRVFMGACSCSLPCRENALP